MAENNMTRRVALGGIVGVAAAPHVAAARLSPDQAAVMAGIQGVFVDLPLMEAEASTSEGQVFELIHSTAGRSEMRRRTAGGSVLLYNEVTTSTLASTDAGRGAAMVGTESGHTVEDWIRFITGPVIYAAKYGVVGDDATDNNAALIAAIAEAKAAEGTLILPKGVIRCGDIGNLA